VTDLFSILAEADPLVSGFVGKELDRQRAHIELIASVTMAAVSL